MDQPQSSRDPAVAAVDTLTWADGPSDGRLARPSSPPSDPWGDRPSAVSPTLTPPTASWFAPEDPEQRVALASPEDAAAILVPSLAGADRERCVSALLDTKHRLLRVVLVSIGSIDHTFMSPREIFRDALLGNATAIVVAHNHPSGDAEPSVDDRSVTRRLVRAGDLVGVRVLDHLVVGAGRWVSLARRGLVDPTSG